MKPAASFCISPIHFTSTVKHRLLRSWTAALLIALLISCHTLALATDSNDCPPTQFADVRQSLMEIEIESTRLGLVSAHALQGDPVSFAVLTTSSQAIQRESTKLDARRLEGQAPWTSQSNWSSLREDIQTVIDANETILHSVDVAFRLKLQMDGLRASFLKLAIETGAIDNDAVRVFVLMNTALKFEGMSAWISVLMSNSRESGLARMSLPRVMATAEADVNALLDGSEDLDLHAEANTELRKLLVEAQAELTSAFTNTKALLEQTRTLKEVSEASSRIAKEADDLATLARAHRNQLPNR